MSSNVIRPLADFTTSSGVVAYDRLQAEIVESTTITTAYLLGMLQPTDPTNV